MKREIVSQDEAWVKQAKRNLTAFYENRPLERMPFEFVGCDVTGEYKPKMEATPTPSRSVEEARREFLDEEFQLKAQLASIAQRVRGGFWDDTVLCLHPLGGAQGWIVEAFGGKTEWFNDRPPYQHPIITEVRQIDNLRLDFGKSDLYNNIFRQMRFFRKIVGDKIPIGAPDVQSPVDVASMIFDYTGLVYAMIDEPQRVHALMRMVTDAIIQACHAFKKEMTYSLSAAFNWWLPRGIFLADDLQAVLNADLYREFAVPYNEIMAAEFGGLGLHSCGRIMQNIENVVNTKGLFVFNTHDPLVRVAPIVKNRAAVILGGIEEVIAPHHPECTKRPQLKSAEALEEYWWEDFEKLPTIKGQRLLYQCHALLCKRTAREAYEWMLAFSTTLAKNNVSRLKI